MDRLLLMALMFTLGCSSVHSQSGAGSTRSLARQLDALIETEAFGNAIWGLQVVDLTRGNVLYSRGAQTSLIPASNMKVYTTSAALDQIGPAFRYETRLYADAPILNGVLDGNLIVRGSGDPSIGGRFTDGDRTLQFRQWADSLKALGLTTIRGDLIGDDDVFDDLPLGYGWSWDDEPFWYSAELGGLVFNDNCVDFTMASTTKNAPATVSWEPYNTDYIRVTNATQTISPDSSLVEAYARPRGTNRFVLSSRIPEGRTDEESLTISNPTLYFMHVLRETLLRAGIAVLGRARDVDDLSIKPAYEAPEVRLLHSHRSPPLREIIAVVNKRSQNLYADQILKTLGSRYDSTQAGSAETGAEAAMVTFARAGVDTSRIRMVDGSGLSRLNLVTPEMTVRLLRYMWTHPDTSVTNAFYESLPIAGVDGSLEDRFDDGGPAHANARAKTGFVSYARTLSGYVRSAGGTPLAFSLMCNHYTIETRDVNAVQDALVNTLARYRR